MGTHARILFKRRTRHTQKANQSGRHSPDTRVTVGAHSGAREGTERGNKNIAKRETATAAAAATGSARGGENNGGGCCSVEGKKIYEPNEV